jgi:antibiotic biosynthesis monooxygenase (ABM) superfamily enzyme
MYGTLMRARVTPGNRHAVLALMGEGAGANGFLATHVLFPDDDDRTVIAAILFEDDATYSANAHDPATEEWYGRFRALLEDEPEWTDGGWTSFLAAATPS